MSEDRPQKLKTEGRGEPVCSPGERRAMAGYQMTEARSQKRDCRAKALAYMPFLQLTM